MTRLASILLAVALASACSTAARRTPADAAADQIREATQRFAGLTAEMNSDAIAATFTADGEMAVEGQPAIQGAEAIRKHLESFRDYHVQSETLTADAIEVHGVRAEVSGQFHQTVRVPDGKVIEAHGAYRAEWVRGADGAWRIRRMTTVPAS